MVGALHLIETDSHRLIRRTKRPATPAVLVLFYIFGRMRSRLAQNIDATVISMRKIQYESCTSMFHNFDNISSFDVRLFTRSIFKPSTA